MYRIPFAKELFDFKDAILDTVDGALSANRLNIIVDSFRNRPNYIENVVATASISWSNRGVVLTNSEVFNRKKIENNVNNAENNYTDFDLLQVMHKEDKKKKRKLNSKPRNKKKISADNVDSTEKKHKKKIKTNTAGKKDSFHDREVDESTNIHKNDTAENIHYKNNISKTKNNIKRKRKKSADSDEEEDSCPDLGQSDLENEERSEIEESKYDNKISNEDTDPYDSDATNFDEPDQSGWVQKGRNFNVHRYGNAAFYVGKYFITKDKKNFKYQVDKSKDAVLFVGQIISVVVRPEEKDSLYFQFREEKDDCYWFNDTNKTKPVKGYYACSNFMSSKSHVTFINKWEDTTLKSTSKNTVFLLDGSSLIDRRVRKLFMLPDNKKKFFKGTIISFNKSNGTYSVEYSEMEIVEETQETINAILRI